MNRYYYFAEISKFLDTSTEEIVGTIVLHSQDDRSDQKKIWEYEIVELKKILVNYEGRIFFEFAIPRMGRRIDVLLIIHGVLFVIEFKGGENTYNTSSIEQVWDYALDLKNFHESSHNIFIAPILVVPKALTSFNNISISQDKVLFPLRTNTKNLQTVIYNVLFCGKNEPFIPSNWIEGKYSPTPTIIEAAMALYNNHSVENITRSGADEINIGITSNTLLNIINNSKKNNDKTICFVTGVPGAGKTLVGLNVATKNLEKESNISSVYLSGNGPLVNVLREALKRDKVLRERDRGKKITKKNITNEVETIIQNVHHFRDECIIDEINPPYEHVAIFDEAQRAWSNQKTTSYMKNRRRGVKVENFNKSEPEFLISCMDRHKDWAVIICLVGGGQEIHTGETGISEWINTIINKYPKWKVFVSDKLTDNEYAAGKALNLLKRHKCVEYRKELHLSVSMRSFRAENLSNLVKLLLDLNVEKARIHYRKLKDKYPIILTRDLYKAKHWLRSKARGSERYGLIVSSKAERLKPHAIDVKTPIKPEKWFLDGKDDVKSSFYLEDVATEFHVQGLELDWVCVTWDGDFRYSTDSWSHHFFEGNKWKNIKNEDNRNFLKNAYRVLLTRARQGIIIVVPEGDKEDPTRDPKYYDSTYNYLESIGFETI